MRFITYARRSDPDGPTRAGIVDDGVVHAVPGARSVLDLLVADEPLTAIGGRALEAPDEVVDLADQRLLAPIPRPPSIRDFMTFEEHVIGSFKNLGPDAGVPEVWYQQPIFYFTNPAATLGPHDDVPVPPGSAMFDFELEVAAVVGREGSNLTVEEAQEHIAGYTIMNDWSARDVQLVEMAGHLGPAKGKDTASTLGPWLVTPDELAPHVSGPSFALTMEVLVNGEHFGADRLDTMAWSFAQMVAHASRGTRVVPGDVLGSGTCRNGCIAELRGRHGADSHRMLEVGDTVTLRVEGLGEQTSRVVEGVPVHDLGPCRARP